MIKVFRLNDSEWYAAETFGQAVDYASELTGVSIEELVDEPYELTEDQMDELTFFDEDADSTCSFQERLDALIESGEKFPCLFACTEF